MTTLASAVAGSMLAPFNTAASAGLLKIYAGTPPSNADAALGGATLLGTLTMGNPAFTASSHTLTANAITQDSAADATGTATFYRLFQSDGSTVIEQGTVGTSGADLNLNTTSIVAGGPIQVSSFVRTL